MSVLAQADFNHDADELIILGNIVDGPKAKVKECVDEILQIKNRVVILGNHDQWFINYIKVSGEPDEWIYQGGYETLLSYSEGIPDEHKEFFLSEPVPYHIDKNNNIFVHSGWEYGNNPTKAHIHELTWNRDLINHMRKHNTIVKQFNHIFVGHTTTQLYGETKPLTFGNLTMMDCGGGLDGKLAFMDIDSRKYWLSSQ